jgi:hypothetical protein
MIELLFALGATKVIGLSCVLGVSSGISCLYLHAADGIFYRSDAAHMYRSGQSHPFPGGLKVIDWRHEPVSDFFSYRSAAAQFC